MACLGCTCSTGSDGAPKGCASGGCASGGCNRHNTYDWITALGIRDVQPFDVVEVSFKNGSRKDFFINPPFTRTTTGDTILVESAAGGYDIGKISLSGEMVRLQLKRKRIKDDAKFMTVIRKAHERDLERLDEIRQQERDVMIRARAIARTLDLNMKIGDVEFQGDGRKCTFFYTADGRVDFRELIRHYAREFKVKIEMRQIGARQESARIGGIGNCGRELCCSTWLTEFKSVNTAAARYQNLAINQTKLSGMCGRLKCCLNYELDTYIDALEDFPDKADRFKTQAGIAVLFKTDVFKRLMFYSYADNKSKFFPLHVDQVWEALEMIKQGTLPTSLDDIQALSPQSGNDEPEEEEVDFENVHNVIQLPLEKRKKKKKKKKKNRSSSMAAAVENSAQPETGFQANSDKRDIARPKPHQDRPKTPVKPQRDQRPMPPQDQNPRPHQPQRPPNPRGLQEDKAAGDRPRPPKPHHRPRPDQPPNNPRPPAAPVEPGSDQNPQSKNPNRKKRYFNKNRPNKNSGGGD